MMVSRTFCGATRPTGENYVWYVDGVTVLRRRRLPTVADQSWKVAGVADFNNDRKPDILWRNAATGDNYVWYLDGTTVYRRRQSADGSGPELEGLSG